MKLPYQMSSLVRGRRAFGVLGWSTIAGALVAAVVTLVLAAALLRGPGATWRVLLPALLLLLPVLGAGAALGCAAGKVMALVLAPRR